MGYILPNLKCTNRCRSVSKNDLPSTIYRGIEFPTLSKLKEWAAKNVFSLTNSNLVLKLDVISSWSEKKSVSEDFLAGTAKETGYSGYNNPDVPIRTGNFGILLSLYTRLNLENIYGDLSEINSLEKEILLKPGFIKCLIAGFYENGQRVQKSEEASIDGGGRKRRKSRSRKRSRLNRTPYISEKKILGNFQI